MVVIGTQSKFDQGASVGSGFRLPVVVCLISLHRLLRGVVPHARRFPVQIVLANQSLLDFQGALRIDLLLSMSAARCRFMRLLTLGCRVRCSVGVFRARVSTGGSRCRRCSRFARGLRRHGASAGSAVSGDNPPLYFLLQHWQKQVDSMLILRSSMRDMVCYSRPSILGLFANRSNAQAPSYESLQTKST